MTRLEAKIARIKRAIAFYEYSPDGQYDDVAVTALKAQLASFKSIPLTTFRYLDGRVRIKKDGQVILLNVEETARLWRDLGKVEFPCNL